MTTLLYIDTAGPVALVGLSRDNQLIAYEQNEVPNTHAQFVQVAIQQISKASGITLPEIDAVVVTLGPGSYTGLRVGLASAKGIAFALNKPLIGLSTLALLANVAIQNIDDITTSSRHLQIFAMIDAKRMEVFGGLYSLQLAPLQAEQAMIIDIPLLESLLEKGPVVCVGSGIEKTNQTLQHPDLFFSTKNYTLQDLIQLASEKYKMGQFENLAYASPSYLKEYYMPGSNS